MARVIVSAGHTQSEPGAVVDDLKEVDLTHTIAKKITSQLRQNGIITLSVPPELDLLKRIEWINKTGYSSETEDICIEIHINEGGKSGFEGWFGGEDEDTSKDLTTKIIESACSKTGLANQGVKNHKEHELKSLMFLQKTKPTGAILECLYIDNADDQAFLKDDSKLDLLAQGIVEGIMNFFGAESAAAVPNTGQFPQAGGSFPSASPSFPRTPPYSPAPQAQPYPSYVPPSPYGGGNVGGAYGGGQQNVQQSREERKQMVQEKYQQILGRKVNDQDLNYFINLGLNEDQMIKRIVDSQEHADMVQGYQEYKKIKPEYEQLKIDKQRLEVQLRDKEDILDKQNDSIAQKNRTIQELQNRSGAQTIQADGDNNQPPGQVVGFQDLGSSSRQTFVDKVLQRLNDFFD